MVFKIVTLFLVFIGVLGIFGKLRAPHIARSVQARLSKAKCPRCGRHSFGKPCECKERS